MNFSNALIFSSGVLVGYVWRYASSYFFSKSREQNSQCLEDEIRSKISQDLDNVLRDFNDIFQDANNVFQKMMVNEIEKKIKNETKELFKQSKNATNELNEMNKLFEQSEKYTKNVVNTRHALRYFTEFLEGKKLDDAIEIVIKRGYVLRVLYINNGPLESSPDEKKYSYDEKAVGVKVYDPYYDYINKSYSEYARIFKVLDIGGIDEKQEGMKCHSFENF